MNGGPGRCYSSGPQVHYNAYKTGTRFWSDGKHIKIETNKDLHLLQVQS